MISVDESDNGRPLGRYAYLARLPGSTATPATPIDSPGIRVHRGKAALPPRHHHQPRALRWLHIPKTGSAFINTLARYGCPELRPTNQTFEMAVNFSRWRAEEPRVSCSGLMSPWSGHAPANPHELDSLAAMFRRPSQRLLSGFHHTEQGVADAMVAPGMPKAERDKLRLAAAGLPSAYARWPGIASCATKMLRGRPCAGRFAPTDADAALAALAVRQRLAFVGLEERWAESICVFHRTLLPTVPVRRSAAATDTQPPRVSPTRCDFDA